MGKQKDGYLYIRLGRALNDHLTDQARLQKTTKTQIVLKEIRNVVERKSLPTIIYTQRVIDGLSDKVALKFYIGPELVNQTRRAATQLGITVGLLVTISLIYGL